MGNKLVIGILIFVTTITTITTSIATTAYMKAIEYKNEIASLEKKLADTEGANEVLVEQLKQLMGGR